MSETVFSYQDYRGYMRERVRKNERSWGLLSRMSDAAACQRSHLSRVLKGHVHLTLDQAQGLCEFWQFSDSEAEYFVTLVELERAGSPAYRGRLERKLRGIRQAQEDLSKRLKQDSIEVQDRELLYYSSWYWTALHVAITIPRLQTLPELSARLSLPIPLLRSCLETLERQGLVNRHGEKWKFTSVTSHLPKSSPLVSLHHNNWRQRAALAAQSPGEDGVHYTMVQTVSQQALEEIKHLILKTIDRYNEIAGPSKEEELICFTCDVFKV